MRKLVLITLAALLWAVPAAQAQHAGRFPGSGNLQNYGAHWRYQHRDWSSPDRPLNPRACWEWNDLMGQYEWQC